MFVNINVCESVILRYFTLLKFAISWFSKVKIVTNNLIHWLNLVLPQIQCSITVYLNGYTS